MRLSACFAAVVLRFMPARGKNRISAVITWWIHCNKLLIYIVTISSVSNQPIQYIFFFVHAIFGEGVWGIPFDRRWFSIRGRSPDRERLLKQLVSKGKSPLGLTFVLTRNIRVHTKSMEWSSWQNRDGVLQFYYDLNEIGRWHKLSAIFTFGSEKERIKI